MSNIMKQNVYKTPDGRNKLSTTVKMNYMDSREFVGDVLSVLLTSCMLQDDFHNLSADTPDNQRYNSGTKEILGV